VGKYVVSSANWRKKFEVEDQASYEETLFELATRAAEWALKCNKSIGIFINIEDFNFQNKFFTVLSYKVLNNAGHYYLAEQQRATVKEDLNIDIAEPSPLQKLIVKIHKASLKKAYCIAKIIPVETDDRKVKIPMVCINLGLFEDETEARQKCKELNNSFKQKLFMVKKITYNL
jgi:hypothetical protein